jgi:hypothetical protein
MPAAVEKELGYDDRTIESLDSSYGFAIRAMNCEWSNPITAKLVDSGFGAVR